VRAQNQESLEEHFRILSDEELWHIVFMDRDAYTPAALAQAERECARRHIDIKSVQEMPSQADPPEKRKKADKKRRRKRRGVRTVFTVFWMLLTVACICAAMGRAYAPMQTVSLANHWDFLYPLLREDIYVDLTVGLAGLCGLCVYYALCRSTRTARYTGIGFGSLFAAIGLILSIGHGATPVLVFPFVYIMIVFLEDSRLKHNGRILRKR
jgi:hypothetical protein